MNYDKDLARSIGMGIPCMHMPVMPMAKKAIKEFKKYVETSKENGMTFDDIINDLDGYLQDDGR
jgi:hypothetical protein